ncbi:right-handed parallel beta-helix repeat-containing protein, partial [Flavisolibacter nicotianae]|uniref:right-handed parallel beta-helix repeat-containing protein n=1 Tax=Flavisolibacter nicotianae TaxID=2364882 RepID=UPI0013C4CB0A
MKLLVFSILISCMCLQVEAKNYYFSSVTGDDNRSMAEAQNPSTPWRTLTKLNSVFSSLSAGDSVLFRRGEVFIGNIVVGQSGAAGLPFVLGAYGTGAQPVITGLQPVSNWTSLGGGLYETTLDRGSSLLNAVTFQDTLQPMGRYPKLDNGNGGYWNLETHVGSTSITSTSLSGAQNYVGGEVVIRKYGWILDRGTITAQSSSTITYSPFIAAEHPNFTYEPQDGFGFFIQNHPNTLTRLGEWCYNTATHKLTMYFGAASPSSYSVKASGVENLVSIIGKNNVVLDNLTLSGANSYAVFVDSSNNLTFSNCKLTYTGVNAIEVTNAKTYAVKVANCTLANTNNNAINANTSTGWTIQNNVIRNTGMVRGMGLSGDGHYNALHYIGGNSLIQGNEIRNTGYIGINFVGDYTVIKNNVVDSFCMVKSDGGGIYTSAQSGQAGRRVTGNLVLNGLGDRYGRKKEELDNPFAGNVHGIYMDGGATDVAIDGNTVANCASSGLELSSPFNVQVLGNTFYNNTLAQVLYYESKSPISNLTVKNNIMFARPAEQLISLVYAGSTNLSGWGTIDSNYYCRPLYEPQGITTGGYPNIGSYTNYPGGGIVQAPDFQFYSLDTWQKLSGVDAHTLKTPVSIPSLDSVRFEYNATNAPRTVVLDATYMDVKGKAYNSGTVTLAPYTSVILIRTGKLQLLPQTITFPAISNKLTTDLPFTLSATASSGLPVSYRVVSGPA